jgi:hypothetical protein
MNEIHAQGKDAPQTPGRRRVLQGLAAPLVLTIVPGAALANGSMGMCLQRSDVEAQSKQVSKFAANSSDEWLRVQRQLSSLSVYDSKKKKWTTLRQNGKDRTFFLGTDGKTYWELSSNGTTAAATQYIEGMLGLQSKKLNQYTFAVAYVDQQGELKGFGLENKWSGKISTCSCWNSLTAGANTGSKFLQI